MARHIWSVLCRKAVVDSTNMLSIFDVIEEISTFPQPPDDLIRKVLLPFPMTLVSYWTRDQRANEEVGKQRIQLIGPNRDVLGNTELEFDLRKFANARNLANLAGVLYAGLGFYEFEVSAVDKDGQAKVVASVPFEIKLGPDPNVKKS
jgi:hypothetical protein